MESQTSSSTTPTESLDPMDEQSDESELTELIAAASPPPVNGSPGVRMGESADAVPFPEVEPEDPTGHPTVSAKVNT